jgi:deoxycytidine triphosphate deaminase
MSLSGFFTDADLLDFVKGEGVTFCQHDVQKDSTSAGSQIQPSSIDLRAEVFYTPGSIDAVTEVTLGPGSAVVYHTKEELNLPADVAGFVFTPTHLSMKGFFSPSIGHIDPGFKGRLRQVGIHMGQHELTLEAGTKVATVVLYKLHTACTSDYMMRNGPPGGKPEQQSRSIATRFANDFGNFRAQARDVAKDEGQALQLEVKNSLGSLRSEVNKKMDDVQGSLWLPLLVALIFLPLMQIFLSHYSGVNDLRQQVVELRAELNALSPKGPHPTTPASENSGTEKSN